MGSGASSTIGLEDLLTSTCMLEQAISAITFPGMYRIYDFHSDKAPKLKKVKPLAFLVTNDQEEEADVLPKSDDYLDFFHFNMGEDVIYIEDISFVNDGGWTALHTCCMSNVTVDVAHEIIDEMARKNCSFDAKTISGPGTFNAGWTALHMACAYGIATVADKLIDYGADVNTENSFGYSPLLEASHRGFLSIVQTLLRNGANVNHLPPDDETTTQSPFASQPGQTALAEAARCGFDDIAQALMDAGADKDKGNNRMGWTPLHEACFYNRFDTVKLLLMNGCDATKRTCNNALPYHLCGMGAVRNLLKEMGGEGAVPEDSDKIDIIEILQELAICEENQFLTLLAEDDDDEDYEGCSDDELFDDFDDEEIERSMLIQMLDDRAQVTFAVKDKDCKDTEGTEGMDRIGDGEVKEESKQELTFESPAKSEKKISSNSHEKKMLHSGGMLGDLPLLESPNSAAKGKWSGNDDARLEAVIDNGGSPVAANAVFGAGKGTKKKKKKKLKKRDAISLVYDNVQCEVPKEFICELTRRPMSDPVKSVYGQVYEKAAISDWLLKQGHICPITGAPLAASNIRDMVDLKEKIYTWIQQNNKPAAELPVADKEAKQGYNGSVEEDLYDF